MIYLQDSCQLQDIVLPVLFKGFDARKSAKQRKGEIWGNVANISTETWFRVKFQKGGLQQTKLIGNACFTFFLNPTYSIFPAASWGYSLGLRKQGTTSSCFK